MSRLTQALSSTTRANKIARLKKHVKRFTTTKDETVQNENGRLVVCPITKYRGGEQAIDKLKQLESLN